MIEPLFIIAFNIILYWPTLFYSIIVDDIRHFKHIQDGFFTSAANKNPIEAIKRRLYGGGTLAMFHPCRLCHGRKQVKGIKLDAQGKEDASTEQLIDCPQCDGSGKIMIPDSLLEHALTIVLHTSICLLMYYALGRDYVSFAAALLYACNGANNQTSIWLNGRRYAVVIALCLTMLLLPKQLALIPYLIMPLFQVNALFAPVLLGGWYWLAIPLFLLIGYKQFLNFYNERIKNMTSPEMKYFHPKKLIVFVKQFGFYILKMVFPGRTFMVYRFLNSWGLTKKGNDDAYTLDGYFLIGAVSICGAVASLFAVEGNIALYILFAFLSTAQWSNIITPTQVCADRYISMANVFVMYIVAWTANKFLYSEGLFDAFIIGMCIYYIANLRITMKMYKDINAFYDYHDYFYPDNVNPRKFRINWKIKSSPPDVMAGWELVKAGLKHNPEDFQLLYQAAICSQMLGDYKASNNYLKQSESNIYLNQEEAWKKNIEMLREENNKMLGANPQPSNGKPRFKPNGDMINFARAKK